MPVENVLIEFLADYSSLDSAIDMLEKSGQVDKKVAEDFKATTAAINQQTAALKNSANAYKGPIQSIDQLDKRMKSFLQSAIDGLNEGIVEALKAAQPEIDAFRKKLEKLDSLEEDLKRANEEIAKLKSGFKSSGADGEKATKTIKKELRELTEQIARAKAAGGPIDPEMIKRAGELKDAVADANAEISNAGSDTRNIDNVVGSISALAGAYSAVQGAAALFGDENEDLQKALLKVNSAMAIATGIQQVANAVQKEGSLTKLADTVATYGQIAAQKIYTLVTGKSTAATKAFKIALASTGIGLLIIGIAALVQALSDASDETEKMVKNLEDLRRANEGFFNSVKRNENEDIALMEERGAKDSEITKLRIKNQEERIRKLKQERVVAEQLLNTAVKNGEVDREVSDQFTKSNQAYLEALSDRRVLQSTLRKQEIDEEKQAAEERDKKMKERLQKEKEARLAGFNDFKAGIELQLLQAEKGSDEELALKKKLLKSQLLIELENDKLTLNQRRLLIKQFFADSLILEKETAKQRSQQALQDIASDLNAELQQLNISSERKLELTESLLRVQAGLEIEAAEGNAAKIAEINARLDRAIKESRLNTIRETFEAEQRILSANDGAATRALERVASDERQKLEIRINAINQLEQKEIESIQRRIALNQMLFDAGLITQREYNVSAAELKDQEVVAFENAERRKSDILKAENERRRADNIAAAQRNVEILSEVVSVLDSVYRNASQSESQQLNEQKRQLKELQEAGAITEKEAIVRQKRLDQEERRIRNQQAQREKQVAVFQALLAIPRATLQGLSGPGGNPILAAIYGGLAAVQAGLVIARPVPKFAKGKKNNYQGPGIVGDAGAELIQRADGSLHVTTKPTMIYLGKHDKVFTAMETKKILPTVDRSVMQSKPGPVIDYDKLASAILKGQKPSPSTSINIDKEFISESVANGLSKFNYYDRYYSSK